MNRPKIAPARIVVLYFACFALGWAAFATVLYGVNGSETATRSLRTVSAVRDAIGLVLALTIHAAFIAVLAWKLQRWLFAHGVLAVVLSGLPLLALLRQLWLVPAFLYLIAVLHVWSASRHESLGQLQTSRN